MIFYSLNGGIKTNYGEENRTMSKAEERAHECFPDDDIASIMSRFGFLLGYQQAEKDNELTWEDIETIQEMANKYCKYHSCEPRFFVYKEVLKRFKESKK